MSTGNFPFAKLPVFDNQFLMNKPAITDRFALGVQAIIAARDLKPAVISVAAGLGVSAVRDLFRYGSSPKISTAMAIAEHLGMTIDEVIAVGSSGEFPERPPTSPPSAETLIPIYNVQASAGPGALVTAEDVVDRLGFPPGYLHHITKSHPRHLAIIGVKGDSMTPTLKDDDLVMIDTSKTDLSYEGLFVIRDDGAALLVKRIGRATRRGFITMISDNPNHPAVERAAGDIDVIGKVVWAGVKV